MLQNDTERELRLFLRQTDDSDNVIHVVLSGSVISGRLSEYDDDEAKENLEDAIIFTGRSVVAMEFVYVPIEQILAWGYGDISEHEANADADN
jgi:hypothetical protein